MDKIKQIVSDGLKEQDKNQIGLKWPLNKAIVSGIKSLNEEETEIIKSELNVKEIKLMKGDFLKVELDLKLTENLEREGYAREITRKYKQVEKKHN
jgi:isoleucyl-tRNA synthetase